MGYNLRATRDESPALFIVVSFSLQSSDFSRWFSERALRWKGFPDRDNLCVAGGIASLNPRLFIDFSYGKFGGREAVALPGDPTATRSEPSDS